MTAPTRVAGWGQLADGAVATWTVAEGRKGRRWREVVARGAETVHALLLETDAAGRFSHLELARADGLWTFHPEPDGTLHGNQVRPGDPEIRHVRGWPFAPDDVVVIDGSPTSLAAIAWHHARSLAAGSAAEAAGVVIRRDGELERASAIRVERLASTRWRVAGGTAFDVDGDGLPVLAGGRRMPLEEP